MVASVLSGNRNFEGRINSEVRANYLMSPPLVVAFALAGRIDIDIYKEPLGYGQRQAGFPEGHLADRRRKSTTVLQQVHHRRPVPARLQRRLQGRRALARTEGPAGRDLRVGRRSRPTSRIRRTSRACRRRPAPVGDINGARVLCYLGDSVTTDHISPAGSIKHDSPAGQYLIEHGVEPADFNSYGSRRGNHEVMMRGTFANVRLRNKLTPEREGAFTRHLPDGEEMSIFDASEKYRAEGCR